MNIKDVRHTHLLAQLAKHDTDEDFLTKVNRALAKRSDYKAGISPSYLSQLKTRERNIGDKTARKFEYALALAENALDVPPEHEEANLDKEFEKLARSATPAQRRKTIKAIASELTPEDALRYARIFLDRVEAGL